MRINNLKEAMKSLRMNKKGYSINEFIGLVVSFVILIIILGVGATIVEKLQNTQTVNGTAYNTSGQGLSAMKTFADQLPLLATVTISD